MSKRSITSRTLRVSLILIALFTLPTAARAAVVINEVMYNPSGADAGREWIELYNDGAESVKLVGGSGKGSWRIADSSNHTITDPAGGVGRGTLTIPAGGYIVIATDPAVFMGEFSGEYSVAKSSLSLNNTGTTVSLVDGSSAVVSSFTYTAAMGGNDDTTSLQRSGDTWLQAMPTPGAANATQAYVPPVADTSSLNTSGSSKNSTSATPTAGFIPPPLPQIFATGGEDRTVIVGADTLFRAWAYDRAQTAYKTTQFSWNFGDGTMAEGSEIMHHFSYPGTYAVELFINDQKYYGSTRILVTAKEAEVGMRLLPGGGVSITNHAGRDLDLSFWQVAQGTTTFTLPERSVVLKDAGLNISPETLKFSAIASAELRYPNGSPVPAQQPGTIDFEAPALKEHAEDAVSAAPLLLPVQAAKSDAVQNAAERSRVAEVLGIPQAQAAEDTSSTTSNLEPLKTDLGASVATSKAVLPLWGALAGLGGIVGLGVASVWAVRRKPVTEPTAEEFTIE